MYQYNKDGFVRINHIGGDYNRDGAQESTRGVAIKLEPYAHAPTRAHPTDAGADIKALLAPEVSTNTTITIAPGAVAIVDTGVSVKVPVGYALFAMPRSSMRAKQVTCYGDGLIDSDYRGTIRIVIGNHGKEPYIITNHDRIGQLVLQKVELVEYVDIWNDTERGTGGFGSTGK